MTVPADCLLGEVLAVTPVSRTWRVQLGGRPAVLRVDEPGARRLGLNRVAEPDVLRAVAAAGLGPACLRADPGRGMLLTEWLPGSAWTAADLRDPGNLRRAAGLLRRVHAVSLAPPLAAPVVDLAAAIGRYEVLGGPRAAGPAVAARELLARCLEPGHPEEGLRLCHNDPTPGNFIAGPDGGLRLIDWEYAGLCHPAFDRAGLALGAALDRAGDGILLDAYWGRPPQPDELARHRAWKAFCQALGALWTGALIQ